MTLSLAPGSTSWLLAHELRLSLRARKRGAATLLILLAVMALLMLMAGLPVAVFLRRFELRQTPGVLMVLDLILVLVFTLTLSQTLAAAVIGFYERGDLDLLLSSPLPPRRALTVRAIAIAVAPLLWFAGLATAFVVPAAALGQVRWLAAYPVLVALALLAAAAGIGLAMALFRLIGARRTRTVGQLLAAFIGAAFFLVGQMRNFLPDHGQRLFGSVARWADSGVFEPSSPLAWPARAAMGDLLPLVVFAGGSAAVFAAVVVSLGRRFAADVSVAAGVGAGRARAASRQASARGFEGGLRAALVRKELRLLLRDPALLSQVLLRVLYILPLGFVMVKDGSYARHHLDAVARWQVIGLATIIVFVAAQLAGSLAWITVSAEDAPELLACAPVDGSRVRRAKLIAAMIPLAVILGPFVAALAWFSPWLGVCAAAGAAASSASAGLLNLWFEKPAPRKQFRGRRTGSLLVGLVETLAGLGWGATAGMAGAGWVWALVPLALTVGLLALAHAAARPTRAY